MPEIGKNNKIAEDVFIADNVIIGDNNIIGSGCRIYSGTVIGNNNVFLEDNMIGSLAVEANYPIDKIHRNGLIIGDNNIFHVRNIISSGYYRKTIIRNNCKFLSDVYISHDNIISDNVVFYPRVFSAGLNQFDASCSVGASANIHQKTFVGTKSMIGMNSTITKNVAPYMVNINNKYTRLNWHRLDHAELELLKEIARKIVKKVGRIKESDIKSLPSNYQESFRSYLKTI